MIAMKMTSAYANKLIKKLTEDKVYLLGLEKENRIYDQWEGEEDIIEIPEYDYRTTSDKLCEINLKIIKLKHAVNSNNVVTKMQLEDGTELTIDQALIRMAQLNTRIGQLYTMRSYKRVERLRKYDSDKEAYVKGYRRINFDQEPIKADYEKLSDQLAEIQLKLDYLNQTVEFEVSL